MTRKELSDFEKNLFYKINKDRILRYKIKKFLKKCENPEPFHRQDKEYNFNTKYLKALLNSGNGKTNYKKMMEATNLTKTTYYRQRKELLLKLKTYLEKNEQYI